MDLLFMLLQKKGLVMLHGMYIKTSNTYLWSHNCW